MKKKKIKEAAYTIIFMMAITAISVIGVASAYRVTKEKILLNQQAVMKRAILEAGGISFPEDAASVNRIFSKDVVPVKDSAGKIKFYRVGKSASVFATTGTGLWGGIKAVIGFDNRDLNKLTGICFTANSETPGLGARIDENWFKQQFHGKTGPIKIGKKDEPHQIDAITGATITTDGVIKMVNKALKEAPEIIGGKP